MAQLQEQGWEVNNHSKTLQLLRKNTERAGPEPPEPPETQGRLCTKIAAAKIKNTVKGARQALVPTGTGRAGRELRLLLLLC